MKTALTFIFITITFLCYSQTDLPIKFKANESADVRLGKDWDYSYTPIKNPININFNGKTLNMVYDSGKVFWNVDIISYERQEKLIDDKIDKETFILKIEDNGFIQYLVIERSFIYDKVTTEIKIPYVSKAGLTISYNYYQEF